MTVDQESASRTEAQLGPSSLLAELSIYLYADSMTAYCHRHRYSCTHDWLLVDAGPVAPAHLLLLLGIGPALGMLGLVRRSVHSQLQLSTHTIAIARENRKGRRRGSQEKKQHVTKNLIVTITINNCSGPPLIPPP